MNRTRHFTAVLLGALLFSTLAHAQPVGQAPAGAAARPGEVPGGRSQSTPARDFPGAPPAVGTATIKCLVTDADTGLPLRRASVHLSGRNQREPRSATTDDQGRFLLRELPAGEYFLSVEKSGYVRTGFGQRRWNEPPRSITLRDGESLELDAFRLQRGGVVTGRVVDEIGEPLLGVTVRVSRKAWVRGKQRMTPAGGGSQTNDLGVYRAYGLPPGEYYVSASTSGFGRMSVARDDNAVEYAPTYFPGTPDVSAARPLLVSAGQETLADLSLSPTRVTRISGVVLNATGRPATGGYVNVVRRDDEEQLGGMNTVSGGPVRQDGTFTVSGLTPGTWRLVARGGQAYDPETREFAEQIVTVAGDDLSGVTLVLGPGGSIKGRVSFEGVAPQDVSAVRVMVRPVQDGAMMGGATRPANLNADGTFELSGLSGTIIPWVMGAPSGWMVKYVRSGGRDISDTGVEVPQGRTVTGVEIVMTQDETKLTGTATDDHGTPVKDFAVVAFSTDREKWFLPSARYLRPGRTNQDGVFTISGLAPGKYHVVALETLDASTLGDPDELERLGAIATEVVLTDREQKSLTLKVKVY